MAEIFATNNLSIILGFRNMNQTKIIILPVFQKSHDYSMVSGRGKEKSARGKEKIPAAKP